MFIHAFLRRRKVTSLRNPQSGTIENCGFGARCWCLLVKAMGSAMSNRVQAEIMTGLYDRGLFRTWYRDQPEGWMLVSGLWSPFYLQLRELCSYPDLLLLTGQGMASLVRRSGSINRLVGIAYAGIPIAVAASLASGIPCLITRKFDTPISDSLKELGGYGQHALVEGKIEEGDRLGLVDDVVTGFDSKLRAAQQLREEARRRSITNITCTEIFVVVDRGQGGRETAKRKGYSLRALIVLREEGAEMLRPRMASEEYRVICDYLSNPSAFQQPEVRADLREMAIRRQK